MKTLLEVRRNLFKFFGENDVFDLTKDLSKVFPISEDSDLEKSLIKEAFKEFVDKGIVATLSFKDEARIAWALTKPLSEYSQAIELNYPTITAITSLINNICDEEGYSKGRVDPLNVTETNIQDLVILISNYREKGHFDE